MMKALGAIMPEMGLMARVASGYLLGPMVLAIPAERQTAATTRRLAEVMRTLGWAKPPKIIRVGTKPCRGFTKTIDEPNAIAAPIARPAIEAPTKAAPQSDKGESSAVAVIKRKPLWLRPL
jgi:hypothetical protein